MTYFPFKFLKESNVLSIFYHKISSLESRICLTIRIKLYFRKL